MAAAAPGPGAQRLSEDNVAKASGIDTGAARAVARINTSNAETETDTVSVLAEGSAGPTKCWAPPQPGRRRKIIIDTDPGVDDALTIFAAFNSPDVEVLGLTTLFGNCRTETSTRNALLLCEMAGRADVPVAEGAYGPLMGGVETRVADFVHGRDGLGDCGVSREPVAVAQECSAAHFICETLTRYPGEVTILAIASLTNVALAMALDRHFNDKVGEVVVLGGAYRVAGNVTPAAEANIWHDPEAADAVFTNCTKVRALGLDVTHRVPLTAKQLAGLEGQGRFGTLVARVSQYYLNFHRESQGIDYIHVHDPTALVAILHPEYFAYDLGPVVVCLQGPMRGKTIQDPRTRKFGFPHEWSARPPVLVAADVDPRAVQAKVIDLLTV